MTDRAAAARARLQWYRRDRLRAKLKQVKVEMRRRRHQPIPEQGNWLKQVLTGYFAYYAVQTNGTAGQTGPPANENRPAVLRKSAA